MQEVVSMALPPRVRQQLIQAGYTSVDELRRTEITKLTHGVLNS